MGSFSLIAATFVKLCAMYPCPELMGNNINIHSQNRTLRPWKLKIALPKKIWSSSHNQFSAAGELLNLRGVESCCLLLHIYCHPSKFHVRRWNVIPLAHRHDYVIYGACISSFTKASNLPCTKNRASKLLVFEVMFREFPRFYRHDFDSRHAFRTRTISNNYLICTDLTGYIRKV